MPQAVDDLTASPSTTHPDPFALGGASPETNFTEEERRLFYGVLVKLITAGTAEGCTSFVFTVSDDFAKALYEVQERLEAIAESWDQDIYSRYDADTGEMAEHQEEVGTYTVLAFAMRQVERRSRYRGIVIQQPDGSRGIYRQEPVADDFRSGGHSAQR